MAQTYTLEEAAQRLGLSPEDFKRRHREEWKSLRSFRDGPTLRFRAPDIDELARTLGEASDPELQLAPVRGAKPGNDDEVSFSFVDDTPPAKPKSKSKPAKPAHETDEDQPALGSGVNISKPSSGKSGKDSDVRIERSSGKSGVPLGLDSSLPTEEIALDLSGPGSAIIRPGQSGKLSAPKSGKIPGPSSKIPGAGGLSKTNNASDDGSSEFELSLDPDSDSFELQLASDEDEVDLGSDAGDNLGALSGINLGKPSDSGLLLEPGGKSKSAPKTNPRLPKVVPPKSAPKTTPKSASKPKAPPPSDDEDFDLSLDVPEAPTSGRSPKTGAKSDRRQYDSGSDFELTLDDGSGEMARLADGAVPAEEGQGDIFETDFELPAIDADSGSEVVAIDSDTDVDDSGSDFEMAIDDGDAPVDEEDSASQVVLVDDDGQVYSEEAVEEDAFAGADVSEEEASISSVMRQRAKHTDEDEEEAEVRTVVAGPVRWGPLPAIVLLPTLLVSFLGMLMSFELVRGMWGYHQTTKPGNIIVRTMADQFGMKAAD